MYFNLGSALKNEKSIKTKFEEAYYQLYLYKNQKIDQSDQLSTDVKNSLEKISDDIPQELKENLNINQLKNQFKIPQRFFKKEQYINSIEILELGVSMKYQIGSIKQLRGYQMSIVFESLYYSEIIKAQNKDNLLQTNRKISSYYPRNWIFKKIPKLEIIWYKNFRKVMMCIGFVFVGFLCLILFIGEITAFYNKQFIPIFLADINKAFNYSGVIINYLVLTAIPQFFAYLSYNFLFDQKLNSFYGFWKKNTKPATLLTCAYYSARMSPPICFNIMQLLFSDKKNMHNTGFYKGIGNLQSVNWIGIEIPKYMPILLILFVIINQMDWYSRFLAFLGFEVFIMNSGDDRYSELVVDGKGFADQKYNEMYQGLLDDAFERRCSFSDFVNIFF